jgi:hypothetical protein
MKLIVIVVIYCLQRYIFKKNGLSIDYMFCKSNGHKIYSSSPKLGKCNYIIVIFRKENSYKLFRTGFTIGSRIST